MGPFFGVSGQAKDVVNPVGKVIGASNRSGANFACSLAPNNVCMATTPQVISGSGWKTQTPAGLAVER
jgi:hypothetical protein